MDPSIDDFVAENVASNDCSANFDESSTLEESEQCSTAGEQDAGTGNSFVADWLQGTLAHLQKSASPLGDNSNSEPSIDTDSATRDDGTSVAPEDCAGVMPEDGTSIFQEDGSLLQEDDNVQDAIEVREFLIEEEIIGDDCGSSRPGSIGGDRKGKEDEASESDDSRPPLSVDLQQGFRILREIMCDANKSFNWPFLNAVDSSIVGCEDYYERVKKPIWLRKSTSFFFLPEVLISIINP